MAWFKRTEPRIANGREPPGANCQFPDHSLRHQLHIKQVIVLIALETGDFGQWYEKTHTALVDDFTRGYLAEANDSQRYVAHWSDNDLPLFASDERGFYSCAATA